MSEAAISNMVTEIRKKADRVKRDLGHVLDGNFDKVSKETKREFGEIATEALKKNVRVEIPFNDRVTIIVRRKSDGSIGVGINAEF